MPALKTLVPHPYALRPTMLSAATEMLIRKMLADGMSQRAIARALGLSRSTVSAIANGRKRACASREREPEIFFRLDRPPERCRTCGARVYMPCLACLILRFGPARSPRRRRAMKEG